MDIHDLLRKIARSIVNDYVNTKSPEDFPLREQVKDDEMLLILTKGDTLKRKLEAMIEEAALMDKELDLMQEKVRLMVKKTYPHFLMEGDNSVAVIKSENDFWIVGWRNNEVPR